MVIVTRKFAFSAAHALFLPECSESENLETFGSCATRHGHNYVLEVSFTGSLDRRSGMIVNTRELKELIQSEVISALDHKDLNCHVEFLCGVNPTGENLVEVLWERIASVCR